MKEYVSESEFIDRFRQMDRKENFSYEGRKALFEYFEQLEEDLGEEIEFDCIAICCEYTEYDSLRDFQREYGNEYKSIEDIEEQTTVIMVDDESFIIQVF
jgi:hypothetical protein